MRLYNKVIKYLFFFAFLSGSQAIFADKPINKDHERARDAASNGDYAEALYYYNIVLKTEPHNEVIKAEQREALNSQRNSRKEKSINQSIVRLKNELAVALPVCSELFDINDARVGKCVDDLNSIVFQIRQMSGQFYENLELNELNNKLNRNSNPKKDVSQWETKHYVGAIIAAFAVPSSLYLLFKKFYAKGPAVIRDMLRNDGNNDGEINNDGDNRRGEGGDAGNGGGGLNNNNPPNMFYFPGMSGSSVFLPRPNQVRIEEENNERVSFNQIPTTDLNQVSTSSIFPSVNQVEPNTNSHSFLNQNNAFPTLNINPNVIPISDQIIEENSNQENANKPNKKRKNIDKQTSIDKRTSEEDDESSSDDLKKRKVVEEIVEEINLQDIEEELRTWQNGGPIGPLRNAVEQWVDIKFKNPKLTATAKRDLGDEQGKANAIAKLLNGQKKNLKKKK